MGFSRVRLSGIMKPRLRAQIVNRMSAVPTRRVADWASGKVVLLDLIWKASVLSSVSFSLFCFTQNFTSEMHDQDWNSCVSSAKDWLETIIGGSCHKYHFCRENGLSRQTQKVTLPRQKTCSVATKAPANDRCQSEFRSKTREVQSKDWTENWAP